MKARIALILLLVALLASACQSTPPADEPGACGITAPGSNEDEQLPFEGLWVDADGNVFAVSGLEVYRRDQDGGQTTEQKGEIVLYDLEANTIQVSFNLVCVDGEDLDGEPQLGNIRYQVDGDRLQYAIQPENYPAEVDAAVFEKKLN